MSAIVMTNGTNRPIERVVDLDRYGTTIQTDATKGLIEKAINLLADTMDDVTFADDGYRNDDAVNCCIALHVLGYDAESWLENWCADNMAGFYQSDLDEFMDHVERVAPYLSKWGPAGHESRALNYIIPW
jgi:hypothetical protein